MVWRIKLLGDIRLSCGEREITRFESRKVVALIACLALAPGRVRAREELAALLWEDAERRLGLERLRHVLSSLQRQLTLPGDSQTPPLLLADRHGIRLNSAEVSSDVAEFEAQVRKRNWQVALETYKGELLPGYYDDWIQNERERLNALYETARENTDTVPAQQATPTVPPPPVPPVAVPRRVLLPNYLTTFFGRETERARLAELVTSRRLVTLLGAGGCGKTRLATEASRDVAANFEVTVFVSLADCVIPEQIPDRVRAALQLPSSDSALEQIATALGESPLLIVLDNLEQLAASGAGEIIEAILARLPGMHCLLTSRILLQIPGEQAFPLAPFPLPFGSADKAPLDSAPPDDANPCLRLFVDRAQMVRPDFALNNRNRDDLYALVRALEGIPLALELCASRIRAHSLGEMRRQVDDGKRFALVARLDSTGRKEMRHGSLYAALVWSWRLLSPRVQDFLAALSTLRGRFGAETATEVTGFADSSALLEELANDSLVQTEYEMLPGGEATFFSLLESVREFAAQHLPPMRRDALRRAHATHLLTLARNPVTAQQMAWEDLPRLQGAVEDALADQQTDEALELCTVLREVWYSTGSTSTALALLEKALALPPGNNRIRAEALVSGAYLALNHADFRRAAQFVDKAEQTAGTDISALASARAARCHLLYRRADSPDTIRACAADAWQLAERSERRDLLASIGTTLGMLANRLKEFTKAEQNLADAEQLWLSLGEEHRAYANRFKRAVIAGDRGDIARARQLYEECRIAARDRNDRKTEAVIYGNLGVLLVQEERWKEALHTFQEGIRRNFLLSNVFSVHVGMWNLAEPLAYTGRGAEAATIFAWGQKCWTDGGATLTADEVEYRDRVLAKAAESLPDGATLAPYMARGEQLSLRDAVQLALNL